MACTETFTRWPLGTLAPVAGAVMVTTGAWSGVTVTNVVAKVVARLPEVSVASAEIFT